MFKTILALVTLAISGSAQARSLDPCTPNVALPLTQIVCNGAQGVNYAIDIHTLSSPNISICQGVNRKLYRTARIQLGNMRGQPFGRMEIFDGNFSYKADPINGSTFRSDKFSLQLNRCVSPVPGGVSAGN